MKGNKEKNIWKFSYFLRSRNCFQFMLAFFSYVLFYKLNFGEVDRTIKRQSQKIEFKTIIRINDMTSRYIILI